MKNLIWLIFICGITHLGAQTLATVNGVGIDKNDFESKYALNIEAESYEKALNTWIEFELLKQEAEKLRVDTTQYFEKLYYPLQAEIVDKYLSDPKAKETLLNQTFERLQKDRNVAVYLATVPNIFTPELNAQKKNLATKRNEVCLGNKKEIPTIDSNITVFIGYMNQINGEQEIVNAVYETPVGNCSEILKSADGWFFVKVNDEVPALGKVLVSQIVVSDKNMADQIYAKLKNGLDYEEAILTYSEDEKTKYNQGLILPEFNPNMKPKIHEALSKIQLGEFTAPIEMNGSYYIFYWLKKDLCTNFDDCKDDLYQQLRKSPQRTTLDKSLIEVAKKNINYSINEAALNEVKSWVKTYFFRTIEPVSISEDKVVISTPTGNFTQSSLLNEFYNVATFYNGQIQPNQLAESSNPKSENYKKTQAEAFADYFTPQILDYWIRENYINNLGYYNSAFKEEDDLLRNAILVNYVIENIIYQKANENISGQEKFLEENTETFSWPKRAETTIYKCTDADVQNNVKKLLQQNKTQSQIVDIYNGKLTSDKEPLVFINVGNYSDDNFIFKNGVKFKKGIYTYEFQNKFYVAQIHQILPKMRMTLKEAGPALQDAYKNKMYQATLKQMRDNADIQINYSTK